MNIQVPHYGLHRSPAGVAFVHQGAPTGHNFIGWKQSSPFEVVPTSKWARCPHAIPVSVGHPDAEQWELFMRLYDDDLFRAFLPIPKAIGEPVPYLDDPTGFSTWTTMLVLLSKLSSPVIPNVVALANISKIKLAQQLSITNLGPLVLTGITTADQREVVDLVNDSLLRPRKLLLVGENQVVVRPPMERISTQLDKVDWLKLLALPMEQLGAVALRRYSRAEQINGPFVKREPS